MLGGYSDWERCETMSSVRVSRVVEMGCGCNVKTGVEAGGPVASFQVCRYNKKV